MENNKDTELKECISCEYCDLTRNQCYITEEEYAVSIEIVHTLRPDYTSGSDKNLAIRSAKIKLALPHKLENETLTWYITWPILNDSLLKNLKVGPVYTINELELYK